MKLKIIYKPKKNKNYICTIAIGGNYFSNWKKYMMKNWLLYCKKNSIGLLVVTQNLIEKKNRHFKSPNWQKLLIGDFLITKKIPIENLCYVDTDFLINPLAPNIFNNFNKNKISLVSQIKNLPYDLDFVRRKIAFNRHHFYSKKYPLDSSLFMNLKQIYSYHKLKPMNDYACSGLFVFNLKKFSNIFKKIYFKYSSKTKTLTGGEEPIFNYEILKLNKIKWLNYKYQTLWIYEIAYKYSFLYKFKKNKNNNIKDCINSSLLDCYFLHFAGSWYESEMWKIRNIFHSSKIHATNKSFQIYRNKKLYGKPKGRITSKS